jgi:hypothetical protein
VSRARKLLAPLLSALIILLLGAPAARAASGDAAYNNSKILEFMNAERQARGVRTVARDPALDRKAQEWAEKLAAEGRMYHSASYAGMSVGYRSAAQNLAYYDDSLSAARAHNMWMASGVHRKNLLDPDFSHVGIAMACSTASGRAYVMAVVEFGGDGSPSRSTPPRTPQVAGGSGDARAMSCDGGSAGQLPAPSTTLPRTTTTSGAPTSTRPPASTTSTSPKTTSNKASTSTTVRRTTTTTRPATTSTDPVAVAAADRPSPAPSLSTAPSPDPMPADLASTAAEGNPDRQAVWVAALAAVAAALLFAQLRFVRPRRHVPKHSMKSGRR